MSLTATFLTICQFLVHRTSETKAEIENFSVYFYLPSKIQGRLLQRETKPLMISIYLPSILGNEHGIRYHAKISGIEDLYRHFSHLKNGLVIFEQICFRIISWYLPLILTRTLCILTYRDKQTKIHRRGMHSILYKIN